MDIIQAWKAAKEGQSLRRKSRLILIKTKTPLIVFLQVYMFSDNDILADDWEVVKEKKKLVFQDDSDFIFMHKQINIPGDAKVTIEWEE